MKFAERLRQLRKNHGWTQEKLAKLVGISEEYVCMLEVGVRVPSYATQEALAHAFGMKISKLMEGV